MKITKIEEQKRNKNKCSIYVDGEYHSTVEKELLDELGLFAGSELNPDVFHQKLAIIQYKSALRAALQMLTRSSLTEKEIIMRLKRKNYNEEAISSVLDYLKDAGYVNDERYIESFIKSSKEVPGASRRSIYCKLAGKGVDRCIIQQKLEEAEIDDYKSALKAAQKKLPALKGDNKEKATKLLGFLYRKGFGIEVCRKVVEELMPDEA